ncbi:MAG: cadherin repeat domain-containing protein, partial [Erysipelotrichaceae bacterium]|nr:cadherin repeat domain-containing protein [Erysipelotrichaceae bacterium]
MSFIYVSSNMSATLNAQSAPTFQLPKGAKIVLGKYNNKEVIWDIGNNNNNGNYVLMSSKLLLKMSTYDSSFPITTTPQTGADREKYCLKYLDSRSPGYSSLTYCPVTFVEQEIQKISFGSQETNILTRQPFLPSITETYAGGSLGLSVEDRAFKRSTWYILKGAAEIKNYPDSMYIGFYFHPVQDPLDAVPFSLPILLLDLNIIHNPGPDEHITTYDVTPWRNYVTYHQLNIRPYTTVSRSKLMFAADTAYTDGAWHSYSIDTSNFNENNELNPNKLRIQSSLTASLQDIKRNSQSTSKVMKNSSVDLSVTANTGTDTKMSVLLYDEAGTDIQYYKMMESTRSGTNDYTLDLTGIPVGKYQVAVINEEYDASSNLPVESSAISDLLPLEIVESHKITYTKTPQSGASAGKDYEFSKNVNAGQAVGKVTANPTGATPLTYTLEANGDNSYLNFEIDGLTGGTSSATSLDVKIKSSAPDLVNGGLKAGNYKFCITAVDVNGDPMTATADSKVCTSITVEKTNLTVAFDDSNQTKKSITDAATVWNETATATLNYSDVKITYSKVGGDIGLIDIDPDTGAITYKGNGAYGKVKIRATTDDDSSSGNDNYNSAYAEKEIVVYAEVNGSVTPHANSSDISTPTFSANDPNIKINGTIGTIKGSPGTPDDVTGSKFTYTYGLKTDGDGSFFAVNASTGVITTKANLAVGSYTITVTVSDKWSTKEIPVTINVGMAAAEDLKFYENSSSNVVISTKSAKATDTNVTVYATVKGSSNSNPVKYKIKDGSTNVIEINEDSGAITIHGVGTVTIVAEKQGGIGQANATAELTFTVTAGSQNFIYTDNAGNELPKQTDKYKAYEEV